KGCYKVGGVDVVKFGLALDPDHPLRCELIITADLATTPQAAAVVASIVEEGRRHAGEPDFAGVDAVPARPNVAAEIAAGPGDRRAIERRRFGVGARRQIRCRGGSGSEQGTDEGDGNEQA